MGAKSYDVDDPYVKNILKGYESYREWALKLYACKPEKLVAGSIQRLDSLAEVYAHATVIFFDGFGVLNIGDSPVPDMPAAIKKLRQLGKQLRVLTNNGSRNAGQIAHWLNGMGFDFDEHEIISCGHALKTYFRKHMLEGASVFYVGGVDGLQYVWEADGLPMNRPGQPLRAEIADRVVLASTHQMSAEEQAMVEKLATRDIPVLCLNADLVAPHGPRELREVTGAFALQLQEKFGARVEMLGKPFPMMFDTALKPFLFYPRDTLLMVGDSLFTDVLGAACAGIKSVLVPSVIPFYNGQSVPDYCRAQKIHPDYYIEDLKALCLPS